MKSGNGSSLISRENSNLVFPDARITAKKKNGGYWGRLISIPSPLFLSVLIPLPILQRRKTV